MSISQSSLFLTLEEFVCATESPNVRISIDLTLLDLNLVYSYCEVFEYPSALYSIEQFVFVLLIMQAESRVL